MFLGFPYVISYSVQLLSHIVSILCPFSSAFWFHSAPRDRLTHSFWSKMNQAQFFGIIMAVGQKSMPRSTD